MYYNNPAAQRAKRMKMRQIRRKLAEKHRKTMAMILRIKKQKQAKQLKKLNRYPFGNYNNPKNLINEYPFKPKKDKIKTNKKSEGIKKFIDEIIAKNSKTTSDKIPNFYQNNNGGKNNNDEIITTPDINNDGNENKENVFKYIFDDQTRLGNSDITKQILFDKQNAANFEQKIQEIKKKICNLKAILMLKILSE